MALAKPASGYPPISSPATAPAATKTLMSFFSTVPIVVEVDWFDVLGYFATRFTTTLKHSTHTRFSQLQVVFVQNRHGVVEGWGGEVARIGLNLLNTIGGKPVGE